MNPAPSRLSAFGARIAAPAATKFGGRFDLAGARSGHLVAQLVQRQTSHHDLP